VQQCSFLSLHRPIIITFLSNIYFPSLSSPFKTKLASLSSFRFSFDATETSRLTRSLLFQLPENQNGKTIYINVEHFAKRAIIINHTDFLKMNYLTSISTCLSGSIKMNHLSIGKAFLKRCQIRPQKKVIGEFLNKELCFIDYRKYQHIVECLAYAFSEMNLVQGDKVAIIADTSPEWHYCDLALMSLGIIVVPIFKNSTIEDSAYNINHSGIQGIISDNPSFITNVAQKLPKKFLTSLKVKLLLSEEKDDIHKNYSSLLSLGEDLKIQYKDDTRQLFDQKIQHIGPESIATIIYTSGTTGIPKGAVITHYALLKMLYNLRQSFQGTIFGDDRTLTFLPLAHVLGRCDSLLNIIFGNETVFLRDLDKIKDRLAHCHPSIVITVPRVLEKIQETFEKKLEKQARPKKLSFEWAQEQYKSFYSTLDQDQSPTLKQDFQYRLAKKIIDPTLKKIFGDKIRFFVSGGAPLTHQTFSFYRSIGITILEGYGLTETIGPCTTNRPSKQVFKSVGRPIGDVLISLADDNELLIKSGALFSEYFNAPEETAKSFENGWFKTGDLAEVDDRKNVFIIGRKKDLIITSGGKNIAPLKIEKIMKERPSILNFITYGEQRKYLIGIVEINEDFMREKLTAQGVKIPETYKELASHDLTIQMIEQDVAIGNQALAKFEKIRRVIILKERISIENGQLTPSLKIKKREVFSRVKAEIEEIYH
jgi:long-chain acyl-CoA synthetase